MKKLVTATFLLTFMVLVLFSACSTENESNTSNKVPASPGSGDIAKPSGDLPVVYMTGSIDSASLAAIYKALGREVKGKVAVKISTGEPGGHHFLDPALIKDLVQSVNGTIVENNTAYGGRRANTAMHKQVAIDHGFTAIAKVDILDEDDSISLPFAKGKNIQEDFVGSHFANYDSCLVLSHFKGHAMGGFGGAVKNISIGFASSMGKAWIHSAGKSKTNPWGGPQDAFLESMAEAAGAVMDSYGDKIVYISVMNHLSVDCDCSNNPAPPEMDDIGILASLDPVALDKACVDQVYASDTKRSASLRERIESRNGLHTLDHAEALGLGSQKYELVRIDG
ncbi:DUF362 domain-containing protein [Leadbettera azotonutricia]|uniref:Putative lipoprotein n=1 Tax=Leadbettera azotonutricia (strain ATCC BAA-888 / DSM 13862 / ZAS-9) TaxID=545695 RepID=F5Y7Z6_LEAAZ|nr:DUF362 domain-containing protein [Leadbettera azotonutricia]AEF81799.1 putative lipoprotein [Leadbettera azotonutricia ZAS-9]